MTLTTLSMRKSIVPLPSDLADLDGGHLELRDLRRGTGGRVGEHVHRRLAVVETEEDRARRGPVHHLDPGGDLAAARGDGHRVAVGEPEAGRVGGVDLHEALREAVVDAP